MIVKLTQRNLDFQRVNVKNKIDWVIIGRWKRTYVEAIRRNEDRSIE